MPRWQPGTRDRLERAALGLFTDRGFDETTVPDIARSAGVTKATFFRLFADKREVLFWGQDLLADRFREAVGSAPAGASVPELLRAALHAVAPLFPAERQGLAPMREAIVDGHPGLLERRAAKRAVLRDALEQGLRTRGIASTDAALAAEIGRTAFSTAYRRWSDGGADADFGTLADEALSELLDAAARLGARAAS